MASYTISIISLILLNVVYSSCTENSTFTQERRFDHMLKPAMINGQRLYTYYDNDSTVVTSPESGYQECKIPGIIPPNYRYELGNGKMVAFTTIYTHFSILDFKNCSTYSAIHIDNGKPYLYDSKLQVHGVIPHHDSFDVYNLFNQNCNPCRYNDKGERLQVNNTLISEMDKPKYYFIKPIKNISDIGDGYVFGFSFKTNDSTTLKVLDSDYNVVKERLLDGQYLDLSAKYGHVTVCTKVNTCPESLFDCFIARCLLLDSNLNTVANVSIHQPKRNPLSVWMRVKNLQNGGAMVSVEFHYYSAITGRSHQDVFIQQINTDGKVEPAIHFGSYDVNYVNLQDYFSKSGEYCVTLAVEEKDDEGYTLLKCVVPK